MNIPTILPISLIAITIIGGRAFPKQTAIAWLVLIAIVLLSPFFKYFHASCLCGA
jgi:hypothetical protein